MIVMPEVLPRLSIAYVSHHVHVLKKEHRQAQDKNSMTERWKFQRSIMDMDSTT